MLKEKVKVKWKVEGKRIRFQFVNILASAVLPALQACVASAQRDISINARTLFLCLIEFIIREIILQYT